MVPRQGEIPNDPNCQPRLAEIVALFARYGNLTFGGGSATIGVLQHEIETKRQWINQQQFHLC
jgi:chromate transport protein ChrA